MKYLFIVLFAFFAVASTVDITCTSPTFVADDATVSLLQAALQAGAALTQVSFTVTPSDGTIAVYYPNSGANSNVGSISNGATGYGNFQVLGGAGYYTVQLNMKYKKSGVQYYFNQTMNLVISGGDSGTQGKRLVDSDLVFARNGNSDLSILPDDHFVADDSTPIWEGLTVISKGPALNSVTYVVTPSDGSISIYYPDKGNVIGNIAANGRGSGSFQLNGGAGYYTVDVKINYKKAGVAYSWTETIPLVIGGGDNGTEGKRAIVAKSDSKFLPAVVSEKMNNATVVGLAIGGIALIAIVAVVVVVAVVRRQRTTIVA